MVDLNQVQEQDCDSITREYRTFLDEVVASNHSTFKEFRCDDERLDTFLSVYLKSDAFNKLWPVCKKLLILSHGQATVERGFSINSQLIVENLKEESVVAQRIVYDAIAAAGGILHVAVTKSLLCHAQAARQAYMTYLDAERAKKEALTKGAKRKMDTEALDKLEAKRRRLQVDIEALHASADELADGAEVSGDLTLLSKSNAMRKSARQKAIELKDTVKEIGDLMPPK